MDIGQLKRTIRHFSFDKCKLGNQNFTRVLIQLFGYMGHGKSSFINTCKYVWEDGEYRNWAEVTGDDGGSTTVRITHPLTDNIILVDNRGFCDMGGYETGEIFAQLGNLLPLDTKVQWSKDYGLIHRIKEAKDTVSPSDFIIPVFVYSVMKNMAPEEVGEMKAMLKLAKDVTGINPIVVLTHKTSGKLTERERTFKDMGVDKIFAVENYTLQDNFKTRGKHEEVLKFINEVIKDAQFKVDEPRDPEREMRRRRKYVIMYVKEREKMMKVQELERQRFLEQHELAIGNNPSRITPEERRQRRTSLEERLTPEERRQRRTRLDDRLTPEERRQRRTRLEERLTPEERRQRRTRLEEEREMQEKLEKLRLQETPDTSRQHRDMGHTRLHDTYIVDRHLYTQQDDCSNIYVDVSYNMSPKLKSHPRSTRNDRTYNFP